jgi:hypothetical protein
MVDKPALDQQIESAQVQYLAPLIANGANGAPAAKPVETENKKENLKFKPNMEGGYVLEIQESTVI